MECGHSRIPVYQKSMQDVVGLLFAKDLVLLNPDDEFKVKDILHYYNHLPIFGAPPPPHTSVSHCWY